MNIRDLSRSSAPMGLSRRLGFGLGAAVITGLLASACSSAGSDDFPSRPLEMVNPFPAGGSHDAHARAIGAMAEDHFGQPLQVSVRSGGAGSVGAGFVAGEAEADGYTMLLGDPGSTLIQPKVQDVDYTPDDLTPVAQIDESPVVLVVPPDSPYDDLSDLVKAAKADPESILYSAGPQYGNDQMAVEMLQAESGAEFKHVPTDGGGNVYRATLAGDVEVGALFPATVEEDIAEGRLKALGVSSEERIPGLEDVPTFSEQGFDVIWQMFRVVYVADDTPDETVDQLADSYEALLKDEEFVDVLKEMGEIPGFMRGEELQKKLDGVEERVESIIEK